MNLYFRPKEDITVYELALIYQHVVAGVTSLKYCKIFCDKKQFDEIKKLGIARHFEIIEEKDE